LLPKAEAILFPADRNVLVGQMMVKMSGLGFRAGSDIFKAATA
jgi:hypothetical protein